MRKADGSVLRMGELMPDAVGLTPEEAADEVLAVFKWDEGVGGLVSAEHPGLVMRVSEEVQRPRSRRRRTGSRYRKLGGS